MSRDTRIEEFDARPANTVELRRHVAVENWPEWALQNKENPLMTTNTNDIQAKLDAANAALFDAGQLAARLRTERNALEAERDTLKMNVDTLTIQLNGFVHRNKNQTDTIVKLQSERNTFANELVWTKEQLTRMKETLAAFDTQLIDCRKQLDQSRRINAALLWDCDGSAADEPRMTLVGRLESQATTIKQQREQLEKAETKLEIAKKHHDATREQLRLTDEELGKTSEALRVTIRNDQEAISRLKNNMARVHGIATVNRHLDPTGYDRIIELTT